jgi:hypothetical protein
VNDAGVRLIGWLNGVANALGERLLAPVRVLPGWLSATLVAAGSGVLLLVVFKYTSNQRAVKRARDDINANLLALKLFKDSARVTVLAQGRLVLGAARLLALAVVPMLVMVVPVTLILGQLSLWYQQRPLRAGEEAVVTMTLNGATDTAFPEVRLCRTDGAKPLVGPVRVFSKREVCWSIKAGERGYHRLTFQVGSEVVDKELAVGDGFMRVSARRPAWAWSDALLYPRERPFPPDSPVRSIEISYPPRPSWASGTSGWLTFWFLVSLAAAFCFRRVLRVNV